MDERNYLLHYEYFSTAFLKDKLLGHHNGLMSCNYKGLLFDFDS